MYDNIMDGQFLSLNSLYYMAFLGMLFIFFLGNKLCDEIEEEDRAKNIQLRDENEKAAMANKQKSLREMYCAN